MAKPPERFTIPEPHSLFVSCESFRITTNLLGKEQSEGKSIYIYAWLANDAFTAELLLKCVDVVRSGTHIKGHKLIELFEVLPKEDQDSIERHYDAQSIGSPNHLPLRELLKVAASLFEMVRYWHDGRVKPTRMNLIYLVTALRNTVLAIRPDWTPKVDLAKSTSYPHGKLKPAEWSGSTLPLETQFQVPHSLFPSSSPVPPPK